MWPNDLPLLPTSLKSLKVLHRLSIELARNSIGNVENLVGDAFIAAVAREVHKAFLVGDGTSNTITGLANESGIQVVSGVGTPTVDDLGPPHPLTHVRHAPGPTDPSRFAGAPLLLALWPVSPAFIWTQKEGTPD